MLRNPSPRSVKSQTRASESPSKWQVGARDVAAVGQPRVGGIVEELLAAQHRRIERLARDDRQPLDGRRIGGKAVEIVDRELARERRVHQKEAVIGRQKDSVGCISGVDEASGLRSVEQVHPTHHAVGGHGHEREVSVRRISRRDREAEIVELHTAIELLFDLRQIDAG